jgi:hypothetical protein
MNKSKPQPTKPHPQPDKSGRDQYKRHVDGDITVRGQIETHLPPEYVHQHDAERKEDKASHNKNFWVGLLTLLAVTIYAGLTFWQGTLTRELINQTQRNFESDQAPVVWPAPQPPVIEVGQRFKWDIKFSNYGRSPAREVRSCALLATGGIGLKLLPSLPQPSAGNCDGQPFHSVGVMPLGVPPTYVSALGPEPLKEEEAAVIKATDGGAIVYGVISYDDAVGHSYESTFCYYRLITGATMVCERYNTIKQIK